MFKFSRYGLFYFLKSCPRYQPLYQAICFSIGRKYIYYQINSKKHNNSVVRWLHHKRITPMTIDSKIIPPNETERMNALRRYEILDTPPDGSFDNLTKLACRMFNMPIAIISLVDDNRIWFKSHQGVDATQIDRVPGLCASAILSNELYVVENAAEDPRTLANPLVAGALGLRFYAAAPLITKEGYSLGTFCVIDQKQRYLTENEKDILQGLADIVMGEMELRISARKLLENTGNHLKTAVSEIEALPETSENSKIKSLVQTARELVTHIEDRLEYRASR
jgi:hypothetical protein